MPDDESLLPRMPPEDAGVRVEDGGYDASRGDVDDDGPNDEILDANTEDANPGDSDSEDANTEDADVEDANGIDGGLSDAAGSADAF